MTLNEIKEHLRNNKEDKYGYSFDNRPEEGCYGGLVVEEVYSERGVGCGDFDGWDRVVKIDDKHFMIHGYYTSEDGVDWGYQSIIEDMYEVELKQVTKEEWVAKQ